MTSIGARPGLSFYKTEPDLSHPKAASAQPQREHSAIDQFLTGQGRGGLISAIVPAFNRQELVIDALESLARQSHENLQIIVVDDGSSDATADKVRDWAVNHVDVWVDIIQQANLGVAAARNTGLKQAQGEFIYFLDSDDISEPFTLGLLHGTLVANPDAPFALGRIVNTDMAGRVIEEDYSGITNLSGQDLLRNHWLLFAALYRRDALRRAGPFNETLLMGEDTELNWRVIAVNGIGILHGHILGQRRHHDCGHLYIDSDETEKMYRIIAMHKSLGEWLADNPQCDGLITMSGLVAMHNYYQRMGRGVDEDMWRRVRGLFALLSPQTPLLNRMLAFFTNRRIRPFYWFGYRVYRQSRLRLKPLKRLFRR